MTLSLVEIALAIAVATAGSLIQASVGYGIGLVLVPGIVLGYMASPLFARFLDRGYLRPAILAVAALSALALLIYG